MRWCIVISLLCSSVASAQEGEEAPATQPVEEAPAAEAEVSSPPVEQAPAAEAEARKNNWTVAIAIVDDGGFLLGFQRMIQSGSEYLATVNQAIQSILNIIPT